MAGSGHLQALAGELNELARALRDAQERCRRSTAAIAPGVRFDQPVCERYARAVADWPADRKPSYEQLALLLSHVNDAAHAVASAAANCENAWRLVAGLAEQADQR